MIHKKTYYEMDYHDLEEVATQLGVENYESLAENEWSNDEAHTFSVTQEEAQANHSYNRLVILKHNDELPPEIADTDTDPVTGFWISDTLGAGEILEEAVYNDILEPGEYLVNISW